MARPEEHDRQNRFTRDVHSFLRAGQDGSDNAQGAAPAGGSLPGVSAPAQAQPAPFDMGMAGKVQAFLKAGQGIQGGQGKGTVKVSSPSGSNAGGAAPSGETLTGQGAEVRGGVDTYEVRGPVDAAGAPARPQPGSATERDRWDLLNGYDHESQEYQRRQQERENWEKIKGIDPESQRMIHGPNLPSKNKRNVMTSSYGHRDDPPGFHQGVDIRNPLGGNVYASESGSVSFTGRGKKYGENYITVQNRDGSQSTYAHTTPKVKVGQHVYSGDVLGVTDMSGRTNSPHLHYGLKDPQGNYIDPATKLPKMERK